MSNSRSLELVNLGFHILSKGRSPLVLLQILSGRAAHALQARQALWCSLGDFWLSFRHPERFWLRRRFLGRARQEVFGLLACTPLCGSRLEGDLDSVVTLSDASNTGLGVSRSVGLSPSGWGLFAHFLGGHRLGESPVPVLEPAWLTPRCCALGLFDGIGGLRRSLERLRCHVVLSFAVESDARARRVVRNAYPVTVEKVDVCAISRAWLGWLVQSCVELKIAVLVSGAGFPCQDVSLLNKNREGASGARSGLFAEWVRIAHVVQELCRGAGICFIGLGECTLMSRADETCISAAVQWPKLELCASGASTCRRPRNYWTSSVVSECEGLTVSETASGYKGR